MLLHLSRVTAARAATPPVALAKVGPVLDRSQQQRHRLLGLQQAVGLPKELQLQQLHQQAPHIRRQCPGQSPE